MGAHVEKSHSEISIVGHLNDFSISNSPNQGFIEVGVAYGYFFKVGGAENLKSFIEMYCSISV